MLIRSRWRSAVFVVAAGASAGCDPSPPPPEAQRPAQAEASTCPGLFVQLLPSVEAVVREYKQVNGLADRQTLYFVDVDYRQEEQLQLTLYSSLDLTSVFAYHPDSYAQVGPDYVALCSGVASLGDPMPRAQAICDVLSEAWYGKRRTRADLEASSGMRTYTPRIWRVMVKHGVATVVDSTAYFYNAHGGRIPRGL